MINIKWNLENEDDIILENRFDMQIGICEDDK